LHLRDVTLRDGLQDATPISTEEKLALFDALILAGIKDMEVTSFARPDRVPAMADADRFARDVVDRQSDATLWGLVLNLRGAERALASGLTHLQFVVSVSEPHNLENTGQTIEASIAGLASIVSMADEASAVVEVTLATAFGCPFAGPVPLERVIEVARKVAALGVTNFSLADTIGVAVPREVGELVGAIKSELGLEELGVHLHNTRGLAIANALRALEAGATRLDGTVGGLGGCPFAPGASGNLVLEDLVHALDAMDEPSGIDLVRLVEASTKACELTGHPQESHVAVAGARFSNLAVTAQR
jgi:hydroxymethylglutaryl-CoA lyase